MSKKIYLPKWTELLVALYNTPEEQRYCEKLHRKIGITIRHLRSLIADLEQMNILTRQGNNKIKYIQLTETGAQLAESFLEIYPTLKQQNSTPFREAESEF